MQAWPLHANAQYQLEVDSMRGRGAACHVKATLFAESCGDLGMINFLKLCQGGVRSLIVTLDAVLSFEQAIAVIQF